MAFNLERFISNLCCNSCQSFYDMYVEANVRFRSVAGMNAVIIRRQLGNCCDWCKNLAGIYNAWDAPDDIYRRHRNCRCMVTMKTDKGYQDVWSKKEFQTQREARREAYDSFQSNEAYKRSIIKYRRTVYTSSDADLSIIDEKTLKRIDKAKNTQDLRDIFEFEDIKKPRLFDSSFDNLPLNAKKEVCKGIAYMNSYLNISNENIRIYVDVLKDAYGEIVFNEKGDSARITIDSNVQKEHAFLVTIHEYAHFFDASNNNFSNRILNNVFKEIDADENEQMYIRKSIMPFTSNDSENLLDNEELFAYSFELIATKQYYAEIDDFLIKLKEKVEEYV